MKKEFGGRVFALAATLLMVVAVAPCVAAPPYSEEQVVLQTTADSFNACADRIEKAATPADMAAALSFAADEIDRVFPAMLELSDSHPDWGKTTPPEIKPIMDEFDSSYDRFLVKGLRAAMKIANDNPDNSALQKAMGRVNTALYSR